MAKFLDKHFQSWLDKRVPVQADIQLDQRRIFIFPSIQSLFLIAVTLLLLVAAINYQNNLVYALVFLLASLFNTAIIFTFINVSGLRLLYRKTTSAFVDDYVEFEIGVSALPHKVHRQISLYWPGNPAQCFDVDSADQVIKLHCKALKRGIFKPGRLLLESYFPLGLIRCWSWIDLGFEALVYPKPIFLEQWPVAAQAGNQGKELPALGKEDFYGFRHYVHGDSLKQVNWRNLAKGRSLTTKLYAAQQSDQHWVDWYAVSCFSVEEKLSTLCGWVLTLDRIGAIYGMRLPGSEFSPDSGELHKHKVLAALALYEGGNEVNG